jgi:hypothetical protein
MNLPKIITTASETELFSRAMVFLLMGLVEKITTLRLFNSSGVRRISFLGIGKAVTRVSVVTVGWLISF